MIAKLFLEMNSEDHSINAKKERKTVMHPKFYEKISEQEDLNLRKI